MILSSIISEHVIVCFEKLITSRPINQEIHVSFVVYCASIMCRFYRHSPIEDFHATVLEGVKRLAIFKW